MQQRQCPVQHKNITIRTSFSHLLTKLFEQRTSHHTSPSKCMIPNFESLNLVETEMKRLPGCKVELYTTNITNEAQHICKQHAQSMYNKSFKNTELNYNHQIATLLIKKIEVNADMPNELRKAVNSQDLVTYFKKKHNWNSSTLDYIDWEVHSNALKQLRGNHKKTILQYIHNWLPVNDHKSTGKTGDACICSRCNKCTETPAHFEMCEEAGDDWNMVSTTIKTYLANKTDPMLTRLLIYALDHWRNIKTPEYPQFLPPTYNELFQQQRSIGWNQILKGRFSLEWVRHHDKYALQHEMQPLGTSIFKQIIHKIFIAVYTVWKNRCNIQHDQEHSQEQNYNHKLYTEKVRNLYRQQDKISACDRQLFNTSIESIISLPLHQLKKWVIRNELFIRDAIKRYKHQSALATHSIKNYFTAKLPVTITQTKSRGKSKKIQKERKKTKYKVATKNPKILLQSNTSKKKQSLLAFPKATNNICPIQGSPSKDNAQFQPP